MVRSSELFDVRTRSWVPEAGATRTNSWPNPKPASLLTCMRPPVTAVIDTAFHVQVSVEALLLVVPQANSTMFVLAAIVPETVFEVAGTPLVVLAEKAVSTVTAIRGPSERYGWSRTLPASAGCRAGPHHVVSSRLATDASVTEPVVTDGVRPIRMRWFEVVSNETAANGAVAGI